MKKVIYPLFALLVLFAFSLPALGQEDIEFSGGYQHISGDQGLDGYRVGIGWNPIPKFQMALNYDGTYDNSTLGAFALTNVGLTVVNSHLQEVLVGPRYFLPGAFKGHGKIEGHFLIPYVDAQFGEARLHTNLSSFAIGSVQAADTAFVWTLGGGADFRIYPHFAVRTNLGFLRTHFANSGQGRYILGIGVVYSFRARATQ
jgi:Outer membrane protein beta-barrel domain